MMNIGMHYEFGVTPEDVQAYVQLVGLALPIILAFSSKTRHEIIQRAQGHSELTGEVVEHGECAHLNHDRQDPEYDDPENGLYVSLEEHAWMHLVDEDNGLTPAQNAWARRQILHRADKAKESQ